VNAVSQGSNFRLASSEGEFEADSLVIASGGLSIPKMGATDFGYTVAAQFGLKIVVPRAGLTPLTFRQDERNFCTALSGVSVDAIVRCGGQAFRENLLFTHRGLSGPSVLQASTYWSPGASIEVDLLPDLRALDLLSAAAGGSRELASLLSEHLPRRFARAWCDRYAISRSMNQYSPNELEAIAGRLHAWQLYPTGNEGFGKAEVTAGGVDTDELSSKTMESRRMPGLYFIGEVVDVTGWLGGYNFQWAWASGFAAGQYA
jgi:predicted Rossmann fold flavoprotein